MEIKVCKYCSKDFERTTVRNQKYCNDFCASRMKLIQKRLRQKKINNTMKNRKCPRCKNKFNFYGMKKFCKDCLTLLNDNPSIYKEFSK